MHPSGSYIVTPIVWIAISDNLCIWGKHEAPRTINIIK